MKNRQPLLRTVNKSIAPYKLNDFDSDFSYNLAKEIVYLLATKGKGVLEGSEWEEIFAHCIHADWKPSNVGLDDVVLGNTAWGAKTVKATIPSKSTKVRLISGRNSLLYSFGEGLNNNTDPNEIGPLVLGIWNERVSAVREKFKNLRTVVLIKSDDLSEVVVFEFETVRFDPELYFWERNSRKNLQGFLKRDKSHKFTWQPHGSQFTIVENVPQKALIIRVKQPETLDKEIFLETIGFDKSWVSVIHRM